MLAVVSVVETLKQVIQLLLAHSVPGVCHLQDKVPAVYVKVHTDGHAPAGMIVFRGVGEQVVQDFVQFIGIEPALYRGLSQTFELVFNLLLL